MRRALDAILLAAIRLLLRVLTPGGRVDALYAVNAAVDWDLEEQGAERPSPALEGQGR